MDIAVPLASWACEASRQRRLREAGRRVVQRWKKVSLATCFDTWADAAQSSAAHAPTHLSDFVKDWNNLRLSVEQEGAGIPGIVGSEGRSARGHLGLRDGAEGEPDSAFGAPEHVQSAHLSLDRTVDGKGAGSGGGDGVCALGRPQSYAGEAVDDDDAELAKRLPSLPASLLVENSFLRRQTPFSMAPLWEAGSTPRLQSPREKAKSYAVQAESINAGPKHISRIEVSSFKGLSRTNSGPDSPLSEAMSDSTGCVSDNQSPPNSGPATLITINSFRSISQSTSRRGSELASSRSRSPMRCETPRRLLNEYYVKVDKGLMYLRSDPLTVRVRGDMDGDGWNPSGGGTGGNLRARLRPFLIATRKPCTYPGQRSLVCARAQTWRLCLSMQMQKNQAQMLTRLQKHHQEIARSLPRWRTSK